MFVFTAVSSVAAIAVAGYSLFKMDKPFEFLGAVVVHTAIHVAMEWLITNAIRIVVSAISSQFS